MSSEELTQYDPQSTYGSMALEYDFVYEKLLGSTAEHALALAGVAPGMAVLDAACGTGQTTIRAAERVRPGGRVAAVDFSPEMLALASEKASQRALLNIDWRLEDITTLDLPPASFDAILCLMALYLVPDMPALVAALWRMLRPGGRLLVTVEGEPFLAPLYDAFYAAARAEAPHLNPPQPWRRTNTPARLGRVLADANVPVAITTETSITPLRDPADWWRIVRATGLARTARLIGPEAAARVEAGNLIAAQSVATLTTDHLIALAQK